MLYNINYLNTLYYMNIIFFIMLTASILFLIFTSPSLVLPTMIEGASSAIKLCVSLLAIYCVWLSFLKVIELAGLNKYITKLFKPITKKLFKGEEEKTQEYLCLNFSYNLLGMGGASTPMGIKAIESMYKGETRATDNMILFVVINCTSIQLLPTTIIGLRAMSGSLNPADIILPSLIATLFSTLVGIILCKLLAKRK